MKNLVWVGIILIILGALALAYQGFTYTTEKQVMQVGPMQATVEQKKTVAVPLWLGGAAVAGGIVLVVLGTRKKS